MADDSVVHTCIQWIALLSLITFQPRAADEQGLGAGVARIDLTPDYSIRLSGYAVRTTESEGVAQRLWGKALALGVNTNTAAVLITVDNCGVPAQIVDEVASRLLRRAGIARERIAIASSHTHSAPCLSGIVPNLFVGPLPEPHQKTIERYTRELTDKLEQVALAALADLKTARLEWNTGKAGFARNRRTPGGPVDHSLPMLAVRRADGSLLSVVANYACHCTTLGGDFNRLCGDWAGFAQEEIELRYPGAIAMITIGCGADANPDPREGTNALALARAHGREIAGEVGRLIEGHLLSLTAGPECRMLRLELPFDPLPTRAQWEQRSRQEGIVGYHAKRNLERMDRGETLTTTLAYPIQIWNFGRDLAMVFLAGEVVVDYALRLKRELDGDRLWITAYANDVPCYIPSRRILREGGYEAETSLWYYDRPARLAPGTEDQIVGAVTSLIPPLFRVIERGGADPHPATGRDQDLGTVRGDGVFRRSQP